MYSFELKKIVEFYANSKALGLDTVMASLVGLEGSSYRKPGVRMLLSSDGKMQGAISGGCVEKDVLNAAQTVFKSGTARVISYDGRYRLGCEGFLFILIEPFQINDSQSLEIKSALKNREAFEVYSFYDEGMDVSGDFGSVFAFERVEISTNPNFHVATRHLHSQYTQIVLPDTQLIIIGAEHDASKLCTTASFLGWNVVVVASIKNPKSQADFPSAAAIYNETPESIDFSFIDSRTATVLMTHNFAQDFQYLLKLRKVQKNYIGILGSSKRKVQLENQILDLEPDIATEFLDIIHSPAGIDISSETPEEIALSITAEILKVFKNKNDDHLNLLNKSNRIKENI